MLTISVDVTKGIILGRGFDSRRLHHFYGDNPSLQSDPLGRRVFFFPLYSKGFGRFDIFPKPLSSHLILSILPTFILCLGRYSLFSSDRVRHESGCRYPFRTSI